MLLGAVLKSVLIYERYFWSYLLTVTYIENFKLAEKELYGIRCYIFTSEIRKPVLAVSVYLMKKKNDVLAFWLFVCLFIFEFGGMPGDITYIRAYTNFV